MAHPILDVFIDEVRQTHGVLDSATAWINGYPARLSAAIQAAMDAGATKEQLDQLVQLEAETQTKREAVVAAIAANP